MNALKVLIDDEDVGATEFSMNFSFHDPQHYLWAGTITAVRMPVNRSCVATHTIMVEMVTGENTTTIKFNGWMATPVTVFTERIHYRIDFEVVNG